MNIVDKLNEVFSTINEEVESAILNGDFEVIERGERTMIIKCLGATVDVWNSNEPESTMISSIELGSITIFSDVSSRLFKKPATCRNILRHETPSEAAKRAKELKAKIAKLEKQFIKLKWGA